MEAKLCCLLIPSVGLAISGAVIAAQEESEPPELPAVLTIYAPDTDEQESGGEPLDDYLCNAYTTCPPSAFGQPGAPAGCDDDCDGLCRFCPGSSSAARFCTYSEGDTCTQESTYNDCGKLYYGSCVIFGTPIGVCSCSTVNAIETIYQCPSFRCQ